jgi:hypothetical protein
VLQLEVLEDRTVPSVAMVDVSNGILYYTADIDHVNQVANQVSITYDSGQLQYTISDSAEPIILGPNVLNPSGSHTNTVHFSTGNFVAMQLRTNDFDDTVNVNSLVHPLSIYGGTGNDMVNVGDANHTLDNILSPVHVYGEAGADDHVTVNDYGSSIGHTYTVTNKSIMRMGSATVYYDAAVEVVRLNPGAGNDTINILSTSAFASTVIASKTGGIDTINVGYGSHTLDGIKGPLQLGGEKTHLDSVFIFDDLNPNPHSYSIGTVATPQSVYEVVGRDSGPGSVYINTGGMLQVRLYTGRADDSVEVHGTAPVTQTTVNTGPGNDTVTIGTVINVQTVGLDRIQGPLVVDGGGQTIGDTLHVNDTDAAGGHVYTIHADHIERSGIPDIHYSNFERLEVDTSNFDDLVDVTSTMPGMVVSVFGMGGVNTLTGSNIANGFYITGLDSGWLGCCGSPTNWAQFQNLQGSVFGDDYFIFSNGQGVSGWIDGGGGTNTLDYSAYTSDVWTNFVMGTATGVAGGIANIQNATGGSGNDILVGDQAANIFHGGLGRDLLIGGGSAPNAGVDHLFGEAGEDILIGGHTNYDANAVALGQIQAKWTQATSYQSRVADLVTGNGVPQLDTTTVFSNHAAGGNTLQGGSPELDLFYGILSLDANDRDASLGERFISIS